MAEEKKGKHHPWDATEEYLVHAIKAWQVVFIYRCRVLRNFERSLPCLVHLQDNCLRAIDADPDMIKIFKYLDKASMIGIFAGIHSYHRGVAVLYCTVVVSECDDDMPVSNASGRRQGQAMAERQSKNLA